MTQGVFYILGGGVAGAGECAEGRHIGEIAAIEAADIILLGMALMGLMLKMPGI